MVKFDREENAHAHVVWEHTSNGSGQKIEQIMSYRTEAIKRIVNAIIGRATYEYDFQNKTIH